MTPPVKAASLNPVPLKERMKVARQPMPEQVPQVRASNFTEVNLGYSAELAMQEARRCLECAKPACTEQCPVGVKVKEFVRLIVAGDFLGAAAKIREDNVLPAITGRVCPQEDHCEGGTLSSRILAATPRKSPATMSRTNSFTFTPTGHCSVQAGLAHSRQRRASCMASSAEYPRLTSVKLLARTCGTCSGMGCRATFMRSFKGTG